MSDVRRAVLATLNSRAPVAAPLSGDGLKVLDTFGCNVFGDKQLRERVSGSAYKAFNQCMKSGKSLDAVVADQIATAMKDWAIENGATHFTHWFQPLSGVTAEKHDSFISVFPGDRVLMNFSGKELIKGEPDGSSFPNGGTRSTFEARGYTVWDMSSPVYLRSGANGKTLVIPTAFCSWTGEALDKKTPLLRSDDAINRETLNLLRLLGDDVAGKAYSTLGPEQEFFLIDRAYYNARPDLVASGRTVLGARPPKGQQMEDHYFGSINSRVLAYLQEVEVELWKLGVPLKTRHNEVAPSQHEMAPIFESASIACDHNMMTMDVMREVAERHNFACLLHEKPFAGVNGSGKHNNWSIATDSGENMLEPGATPAQNMKFMVFLAAVIRAVDVHADVLRASIVTPGNDFRLGANEAPPAIISIFLGAELDRVCRTIMDPAFNPGVPEANTMTLGVSVLPPLPRDPTDRNRTSPFAFTGNKFEFRAAGSSQSCADTCMAVNAVVADAVRGVASEIEALLKSGKSIIEAANAVVADNLKKHYRVVFNGNGYSQDWVEEAARRGLPNYRNCAEALSTWSAEKNVKLFESLNILSRTELVARGVVKYEIYIKSVLIEAQCALAMASTQVLPAAIKHQGNLASSLVSATKALGEAGASSLVPQKASLASFAKLTSDLVEVIAKLESAVHKVEEQASLADEALFCKNTVMEVMSELRGVSDALEGQVDDCLWSLPKYSEMLLLK